MLWSPFLSVKPNFTACTVLQWNLVTGPGIKTRTLFGLVCGRGSVPTITIHLHFALTVISYIRTFPGQPEFPQFQILVGPQPGELQSGRPTSLDCDWRAPSPPEVTWTKDGVPLDLTTSGSGRLLTNGSLLLSGERSQAGNYQCSLTVDSVGTLLSSPARLVAAGQCSSPPSLSASSEQDLKSFYLLF